MAGRTEFKMIPDADELAAIEREAAFRPSAIGTPSVLAPAQVEHFNRQGYLTGMRIFDDAEVREHRRYFDRLLEGVLAAGGDSYSISSGHLKYGRVYDLLTHPRIVSIVADLLGDDIIGWGTHYFCKMPHDGKAVAWHQDFSYWPLSASRTVTVWLAIDDARRDNACVQFIPGSHLHGLIPFQESQASEGNVLNQTIADVDRFGKHVDIELSAGQISLHSDLLIHGSEANQSNRRRCGLTLRYCTPDVRAHLDWNHKGVVVRGSDPSGHWLDPPRPTED